MLATSGVHRSRDRTRMPKSESLERYASFVGVPGSPRAESARSLQGAEACRTETRHSFLYDLRQTGPRWATGTRSDNANIPRIAECRPAPLCVPKLLKPPRAVCLEDRGHPAARDAIVCGISRGSCTEPVEAISRAICLEDRSHPAAGEAIPCAAVLKDPAALCIDSIDSSSSCAAHI